jgi:hypothetical protein
MSNTHFLAAIIIPIYKPFEENSANEILSLTKAIETFKDRDIYLVGPASMNHEGYKFFFMQHQKGFHYQPFPDRCFTNVAAYTKLCLSAAFYQPFLQYPYMLLYQLDAWVFRDELDKWCAAGFDYIGAPWFVGYGEPKEPLQFLGVGNGGFSLRKIRSFYKIAGSRWWRFLFGYKKFMAQKIYSSFLFKKLPGLWRLSNNGYTWENEDFFWGMEVPKHMACFKVAPPEIALQFSFEVAPEYLFGLNGNRLPFGCHAWEKYGRAFWKKFIPSLQGIQ